MVDDFNFVKNTLYGFQVKQLRERRHRTEASYKFPVTTIPARNLLFVSRVTYGPKGLNIYTINIKLMRKKIKYKPNKPKNLMRNKILTIDHANIKK